VDRERILASGMRLANTPGLFSAVALAEHALFLMLCFAKRLRDSERNVRSGRFHGPVNDELHSRTLGMVGFGASARELAARARAFGMPRLAIDARVISAADRDAFGLAFAGSPDDLEHLLRQSDYVSLHVPLTPATRHMLGPEQLAAMRPGAVLINVARGAVVDQPALVEALRARRIRGAGLDVFDGEPLPPEHPLLHLENVIATPHVAGATDGTSRRRGAAAAENVMRIGAGLPPLYEIGPGT
jgi:phosphoglycerate dehydrogenase-like enzyme